MKILIVASELPPVRSGVSRSVGEIIEGLEKQGHDVFSVSSSGVAGLRWDRIRISTVAFKVRKILRDEGPFDVVNIHGPSPSISDLSLLLSVISRNATAVVYTHHFRLEFGKPLVDSVSRFYEWLIIGFVRRFCLLVFTSSDYANLYGGGRKSVHVIPWGVDQVDKSPNRPVKPTGEPLKVLAVGQLRRYKGMAVAIEAAILAKNSKLTIVGDGPLYGHFAEIASRHADKICLMKGITSDELKDIYKDNDVILLSSRTKLEAFGLVLLEGMSYGCVPVASNLPGVRQIAESVGFLCEPNDPLSIARIMDYLSDNHDVLNDQSCRSYSKTQNYLWGNTVLRYEELFEKCSKIGT